MAIKDKLEHLLETKQAIKQAIIDKGQSVADTDTFRSYAEKIEAIEAGGGGTYDAVNVYKETRPKDWLNMMGTGRGENYDAMETYYDTHDNEIRLLFHLSPPNTNLLAFQCKTSSGTYNVSYAKANGEIVSTDIASNSVCELTLDYDDFSNETSDGIRQVLIVIKPSDNTANLLTFNTATHSAKTNPSNYKNWCVMEIMGKCTSLTNLKPFGLIRYCALFGKNNITDANKIFHSCSSLTTIPQLDTSKVTNMWAMFYNCRALRAIPQFDTGNVDRIEATFYGCTSLTTIPQLNTSKGPNMSDMFYGCVSLTTIPQFDTSKVTNMSHMFDGCSSLTTIPQLDTSNTANMSYMFSGCNSLTTIPQINTSKVTNTSSMFGSCSSLMSIPQLNTSKVTNMSNMFSSCQRLTSFTITATNWAGVSFSINQCSFDYEALLNLLGSLPLITGTGTATLTNNIGTAQLSAEVTAGTPPAEYTQAVANGWTIAL